MHIGGHELWVVMGLGLLLFGAKRLPELGRSLGQGIREFRRSTKGALDDEDTLAAGKSSSNQGEASTL